MVELILAENTRARHVVERLGFELEGVMRGHVRRRDRLLDVAVYGLAREAWARLRAELVADGGERALSADFFRSAEFHAAEEVTHTLVVEDRLAVALVVSEIPGAGGLRDATSAYGYPGALLKGEPLDPAQVDWSGSGLVTVFLRDAIGRPPSLLGASLRSEVHVADPREPLELRSTHARHVRRNERLRLRDRRGVGTRRRWPTSSASTRRRWSAPRRATATSSRDAYFEQVLSSERALLLITRTRRRPARRRARSSSRATATCTTSSAAAPRSCSSTRPSRPR